MIQLWMDGNSSKESVEFAIEYLTLQKKKAITGNDAWCMVISCRYGNCSMQDIIGLGSETVSIFHQHLVKLEMACNCKPITNNLAKRLINTWKCMDVLML